MIPYLPYFLVHLSLFKLALGSSEAVNGFTPCYYDTIYHESFSAAALAFAPLAFFSGVSFLVLLD